MTNHTATEKQKGFLAQLMLSSAFTASEAQRTYQWIETPACTHELCKAAIDKALKRIDARNQARQDAAQRQDAARQQKEEADAETHLERLTDWEKAHASEICYG